MNKLLVENEWYVAVPSRSLYEREFEEILLDKAGLLFPGFLMIPFKRTVYSEDSSARADLALVHLSYQEWWVVEAEMEHHSLDAHIVPQIRTLLTAAYGQSEADYLSSQSSLLSQQEMRNMLKGKQPRVLVITNGAAVSWFRDIPAHGAELLVVDLFRSEHNQHIVQLRGNLPEPSGRETSFCTLDPMLPRFLIVESPALLGVLSGESIRVEHDGVTTAWKRLDAADKVWIAPDEKVSLAVRRRYRLEYLGERQFTLKQEF